MTDPAVPRMKRVLVVDDEENIRHLLLVVLKKAGYEGKATGSVEDAWKLLESEPFGIVISDVRMPGHDGKELLRRIARRGLDVYTVMMSAYGGDEAAIECMKAGAYDYINKPFRPDEVILVLRKVEEREALFRENQRLRAQLDQRFDFDHLIGQAGAMRSVFDMVAKVAPYKTTVLLTGESGTGKELLARALHRHSPRGDGPLIPVNCGAIPEALLESELFGHVKGAFTGAVRARRGLFAEADGGTIFLDEIGELPVALQVKLLRVLQEEEIRPVGESRSEKVDVRVVAATSRDLEEQSRTGAFREDLYYRLNVIHIRIPPLRARRDDVPALVDHFVGRLSRKFGRTIEGVEPEALEAILSYEWPGNVRELENAIERAILLSEGAILTLAALPPAVQDGPTARRPLLSTSDDDLSIKRRVATLEAELIARALDKTGGNRTHACRLLDISHRALLYKMRDYGIDTPARRGG